MRNKRRLIPTAIILSIVASLTAFKVQGVDRLVTAATGVDTIDFGILALKHDSIIFASLILLFVLSTFVKRESVGMLVRSLIVIIVLLWMLDILILSLFGIRLEFSDIKKFFTEVDAVGTFVDQMFYGRTIYLILLSVTLLLVFLAFIVVHVRLRSKPSAVVLLLISFVMSMVFISGDSTYYVHKWVYENIYEINSNKGISKPYSNEYMVKIDNLQNDFGEKSNCILGANNRKNVVILLIESLSMYHSNFFSDLPTMAPNFDRIAKENTAFTNFFANGFTTEAGLISVLTGRHLFPPLEDLKAEWLYESKHRGFYDEQGSLPDIFNQNGYLTYFATSGELGFLNKGPWLESIGFDYLEGADVSFYNSWPRFSFNAPPDEALYQRILFLLNILKKQSPFMLTVETVSTHQPFINPENGANLEESVFRYADRQLGAFYDALKSSDYFDNGILLILGDHRSMTGIRKEEIEIFGNTASARVPMVIVYGDSRAPSVVDTLHQQVDFIPSFEYFVSRSSCSGALAGNFLSSPRIEANYVLFPRGDDRDIVDVFSGESDWAKVRINGDDTSVINTSMQSTLENIVEHIAKERIRIQRTPDPAR